MGGGEQGEGYENMEVDMQGGGNEMWGPSFVNWTGGPQQGYGGFSEDMGFQQQQMNRQPGSGKKKKKKTTKPLLGINKRHNIKPNMIGMVLIRDLKG